MSSPPTIRKMRDLIVSQIVLDTFEELKMSYPKTTAARRRELLAIRKGLAK